MILRSTKEKENITLAQPVVTVLKWEFYPGWTVNAFVKKINNMNIL